MTDKNTTAELKVGSIQKKVETFEPFYDRILVRPIKAETMTPGGLFLPDNQQEQTKGKVVAIGFGYRDTDCGGTHALRVDVGDVVMYHRSYATEITINGEKLLVMPESSIVGRFT